MPERQVYRYSGPETYDPAAIRPVLARTRSVHVTHGGYLSYAVDPKADALAESTEKYVKVLAKNEGTTVRDPGQVTELASSLEVDLVTDILCMCPGDLAVECFDAQGRLLTVLRIDMPDSPSWPHWPGSSRVSRPDRLHTWLAAHGLWSARRPRESSPDWWTS